VSDPITVAALSSFIRHQANGAHPDVSRMPVWIEVGEQRYDVLDAYIEDGKLIISADNPPGGER